MFYLYDGYYFWGMHLVWWFFWLVLIVWIFIIPYDIPGERKQKDSSLDVLKKRFASGDITKDEYLEQKKLIIEK